MQLMREAESCLTESPPLQVYPFPFGILCQYGSTLEAKNLHIKFFSIRVDRAWCTGSQKILFSKKWLIICHACQAPIRGNVK